MGLDYSIIDGAYLVGDGWPIRNCHETSRFSLFTSARPPRAVMVGSIKSSASCTALEKPSGMYGCESKKWRAAAVAAESE